MPPLAPVPNCLKVEIMGTTTAGLNWANILHFNWSGTAPTVAACEAIAEQVFNEYNSQMLTNASADISLTEVQVTDLTSNTSSQGSYEGAATGDLEGSVVPAGASVLAQYASTLRYRGGHPRTYLVLGESLKLENTSTWTSAFVTAVEEAWTAFLAAVVGYASGGCTVGSQVAVSYSSGHAPRPDPIKLPLTFTGCSATVASQRRRTRRRS
jgi:hypothetical protein